MTGIARVIPFIILLPCMLQFLKDAVRELRHVVWPTRKETQKFFFLALSLIIAFTIYLFVFSQIFSEALFSLKDIFWTSQSSSTPLDIYTSDIFLNEETLPEESVFSESDVTIPDETSLITDEENISPESDESQQ